MRKNKILNALITARYEKEDVKTLAEDLGITISNLRVRASRLGLKKGSISNKIEGGMKHCPKCDKIKPLESFNRDKYQPNGYDYYCRACRNEMKTFKAMDIEEKRALYNDYDPSRVDMAFNKGHKVNKVVVHNGVEYLRCKMCNQYLTLDHFHKDKKASHGHKNYCKSCLRKKREGLL